MDEKPKKPRKKPALGKVDKKHGTLARDSQVLRIAVALLGLTPSKDCTCFGVTRQTFSKWMRGETSAPREVYVVLLESVINAAAHGKANYAAAESARLEKVADERVAAALKKMAKLNPNGEKR